MATLTKNRKRILASAKVRDMVARLSTGIYYTQFQDWNTALRDTLNFYGLQPWGGVDTPHNNDGRGTEPIVTVEDNTEVVGYVWYSYHRMEGSGNWEIICYIS